MIRNATRNASAIPRLLEPKSNFFVTKQRIYREMFGRTNDILKVGCIFDFYRLLKLFLNFKNTIKYVGSISFSKRKSNSPKNTKKIS